MQKGGLETIHTFFEAIPTRQLEDCHGWIFNVDFWYIKIWTRYTNLSLPPIHTPGVAPRHLSHPAAATSKDMHLRIDPGNSEMSFRWVFGVFGMGDDGRWFLRYSFSFGDFGGSWIWGIGNGGVYFTALQSCLWTHFTGPIDRGMTIAHVSNEKNTGCLGYIGDYGDYK